mmetsp:Transcript_57582/g.130476  ORF Transcript_57582/g.130476 Transcript_57582/m.130476 type:complete len:132 (+) Transcript_57582:234-629(+)
MVPWITQLSFQVKKALGVSSVLLVVRFEDRLGRLFKTKLFRSAAIRILAEYWFEKEVGAELLAVVFTLSARGDFIFTPMGSVFDFLYSFERRHAEHALPAALMYAERKRSTQRKVKCPEKMKGRLSFPFLF